MRKILLLLICTPIIAFAQRTVDNEEILAQITNGDSQYYYPRLMGRYMVGDRTLTEDDYYYLYYGYAFQDSYNPLNPAPIESSKILAIFERNPEPGFSDALEIIALAKEVMKSTPFSPTNINFLTYAYGIVGDTINERTSSEQFKKIISTIKSTGTGVKENSPWVVLSFADAGDVIASMGLQVGRRIIVSRSVEFISLTIPEGKIKGYYFDYSRVYWRKPDAIPEKSSGGWMFNGIKLK